MFLRFFDEGLAQASYLIACLDAREAVVVDPRRDVDGYLAVARRHGLAITAAIESHIHADFVSGARELAAAGAGIVAGPGADLAFPFHEAADAEEIVVGRVVCTVRHTPGHTPEHVSLVVREPGAPTRVLTGDTLFVGAVGRPDLLGEAQTRQLAGELHDSVFGTLLRLGDDVEVHPGHGAGSLCGAGIGGEPFSTIGRERGANPFLQATSRDDFVRAVLADLPDTPPYFPRMKALNRAGPPVLALADGVAAPAVLTPSTLTEAVAGGALVVDLRTPEAYADTHVLGAFSLAFGPKVGYWAGWVLPEDRPIVLIGGKPRAAADATRQLLRVGFDRVRGWLPMPADPRAPGVPRGRIERIPAADLRRRQRGSDAPLVLDVRTRREFESGHVDGAINIPVGELPRRCDELRGAGAIATICESGFRSSLASSLLERAGVSSVSVVSGGMAAYRGARGR